MNRQRSLDDGFMHAVFNPSLAPSPPQWPLRATVRRHILRESPASAMSSSALNETPDKLNRDRRLVLLSDPVTMSRLHTSRMGRAGETLSRVNAYQQLALNPLALRKRNKPYVKGKYRQRCRYFFI